MDCWYGGLENLKHVLDLGWACVTNLRNKINGIAAGGMTSSHISYRLAGE